MSHFVRWIVSRVTLPTINSPMRMQHRAAHPAKQAARNLLTNWARWASLSTWHTQVPA